MKISNWGNYPVVEGKSHRIASSVQLPPLLKDKENMIARGLGRCYGDSSLAPFMLNMRPCRKITAFNKKTGAITCQAGVSLEELLNLLVPRGWFLPVTPGTKFITVGGAVAANVHGKNHHKDGSFCRHVTNIELMLEDGSTTHCSRKKNKKLFETTCGGMGLTGIILSVSFKLKPIKTAYIKEETIRARNLDEIMAMFEESSDWTYSVAWIDCLAKGSNLGRSIMMRGEHAETGDLSSAQSDNPLILNKGIHLNVPVSLPSFTLNKFTVSVFNYLIYHKYKNETFTSNYNSFFYPLDSIDNWNRIYGGKGFTQYQCVLPKETSREGIHKILTRISDSGLGSFLAVLKLFGKQDDFISFPMEGYTLALDFPITGKLFPLLEELDRIVLNYGGRIYLAKDVRMTGDMFRNSYPNANAFITRIKEINPKNTFRSLQSDRLGITI